MATFWLHFGYIYGDVLATFWATFWLHFGYIVGDVLATYWRHFGRRFLKLILSPWSSVGIAPWGGSWRTRRPPCPCLACPSTATTSPAETGSVHPGQSRVRRRNLTTDHSQWAGTDVMILKIFSPKKLPFLTENTA
jgi:hypothetical protein